MEVKKRNNIIGKALGNEVVSENLGEKMETEEIVYLNRLKNLMGCFSIESTLYSFLHQFDNVNESYKTYLTTKYALEAQEKVCIEKLLHRALDIMPDEIEKFVAFFLTNMLKNDYTEIDRAYKQITNSTECRNFIKEFEDRLELSNPYKRNLITQYIQIKYSNPSDSIYVNTIDSITNSALFGLLYIMHE